MDEHVCERGTRGCHKVHGFAGDDHCEAAVFRPVNADDVIAACGEALARSGGADVVYVHADGAKPAVAAVVRPGTAAWERLHTYPDPDTENEWASHDHIEPGMF